MFSVKQTIERFKLINRGDVVGCAVSGGSDSMALLHYLAKLSVEMGFSLKCVNVEHGIRGAESLSDTEFVKSQCEKLGIEFIGESVDAKKHAFDFGMNLEQAARELRYGFFRRVIKDGRCDKIAVAHNLSDNAETILLNILRGSGLGGVSGMSPCGEGGIIRPLLYTQKSEILLYLQENNIAYVTDSTNADTAYSRNYLRSCVFPPILERFPYVYENIQRFAEIAGEENAFLDSLAKKYVSFCGDAAYVTLPCERTLLRRAAMAACRLLGAHRDIESVHLNACADLAEGENGSMLNLGCGIDAYREYGKIAFVKRTDGGNFTEIPFGEGSFEMGNYRIEVIRTDTLPEKFDKEGIFYADADKIGEGAVLRFRKNGDTFRRFGGGNKSLSDFFTDNKVPLRLRGEYPLVARQNKVLALFPFDISEDIKTDKGTKTIFKIKYFKI